MEVVLALQLMLQLGRLIEVAINTRQQTIDLDSLFDRLGDEYQREVDELRRIVDAAKSNITQAPKEM